MAVVGVEVVVEVAGVGVEHQAGSKETSAGTAAQTSRAAGRPAPCM